MSRSIGKSELQALYQRSLSEEPHAKELSWRKQIAPLDPSRAHAVVGLVIRYSRDKSDLDFLLTYRSDTLEHHPSEVCLPGGRVEHDSDEAHRAALDREIFEEVGIPVGCVEWEEKPWDSLVSLHGFQVFPYLGFIDQSRCPESFRLQEEEVSEAAWLPLSQLLDPENWELENITRPFPPGSNETRTVQMPVWKGWNHRTWGLTAAFLALFVRRISGCTPY